MSVSTPVDRQLLDTQRAFDSVAAAYDGPLGNNALVQLLREQLWQMVGRLLPRGARLLDLGCGTGIDAVHFAGQGYELVAADWSPQMVARTCARAAESGVAGRVSAVQVGIQELDRLQGEPFDGLYSDLGPLNCVADLRAAARASAALLKPGGRFIASVIGRVCPWEFAYYAFKGDWARARLRGRRGPVPVQLNRETVWTTYYTPREFYGAFARDFVLTGYRALALFMPPPYLVHLYARARPLFAPLGWLDEHVGALPLARDAGDHFLMVLTKRE